MYKSQNRIYDDGKIIIVCYLHVYLYCSLLSVNCIIMTFVTSEEYVSIRHLEYFVKHIDTPVFKIPS